MYLGLCPCSMATLMLVPVTAGVRAKAASPPPATSWMLGEDFSFWSPVSRDSRSPASFSSASPWSASSRGYEEAQESVAGRRTPSLARPGTREGQEAGRVGSRRCHRGARARVRRE